MKGTHALFMVIFKAYADPNTDGSHIEVRMLSMMVVGPKQYANANTPKEAAAPVTLLPKHSSNMEVNIPTPQKSTRANSEYGCCMVDESYCQTYEQRCAARTSRERHREAGR